MRILGIDPGYAILGYGVIDVVGNKFKVVDYGAITTDTSMDMSDRLKYIYHSLMEIYTV
jgi:crossover junction endodeoxyribonuclease RuvC